MLVIYGRGKKPSAGRRCYPIPPRQPVTGADYTATGAAISRSRADSRGMVGECMSSSSAGSPMYFYCRHCGIPTEVLPEDFIFQPMRECSQCQLLKIEGWLETAIEMGRCDGRGSQWAAPCRSYGNVFAADPFLEPFAAALERALDSSGEPRADMRRYSWGEYGAAVLAGLSEAVVPRGPTRVL